jgi:hypothetical protein
MCAHVNITTTAHPIHIKRLAPGKPDRIEPSESNKVQRSGIFRAIQNTFAKLSFTIVGRLIN